MSDLAQINLYPIKSTRAISLSHAFIDDHGLSFDRRFVLSDISGTFITARTHPKLCLIQCLLTPTGLVVCAPEMEDLIIDYQQLSSHYQPVDVWGTKISGQYTQQRYDKWFSRYLNKPCQLLYFGEQSTRNVENSAKQVAFADAYPLLLISKASLLALNHEAGIDFSMTQFRPNLVVENTTAFAEDNWQHIRIGDIEFEVTKPCARCIFTTLDPDTGVSHPQQEPLATLKRFRQAANGDVMFGQNLIPLSKGVIKKGDPIEVLASKHPPRFNTLAPSSVGVQSSAAFVHNSVGVKQSANTTAVKNPDPSTTEPQQSPQTINLRFTSWDKEVDGNNHQSILEQGENAGMMLPFSCRAGMCGRCKVKLVSGDVNALCSDGLTEREQQQGYVLACSCIPCSDLVIERS